MNANNLSNRSVFHLQQNICIFESNKDDNIRNFKCVI